MNGMEITTLTIAVIGCLLGVFNTWQAWDRSRIKIRVKPQLYTPNGGHELVAQSTPPDDGEFQRRGILIEVVNDGEKSVTVGDVGFLCRGSGGNSVSIRNIGFFNSVTLPFQLKPCDSIRFILEVNSPTQRELGSLGEAYVTLTTGRMFKGSSAGLEAMARFYRAEGNAT
jgi:hypothetical protein